MSSEIERLSPDRLMSGFSKSRILTGMFLSVVIHFVVLGATSVDYVHGVIDPAWKKEQEVKKEAERQAERAAKLKAKLEAEGPPVEEKKPADSESKTSGGEKTKPSTGAGMSEEERMMKARAETPMVKTITDTATPDELPKEPDMEISIQDTNPE
jgi:hypothetical protein